MSEAACVFREVRNLDSFGLNVREAGLFLEGHLFEFTDLPEYLWAGKVNEQHPPERKKKRRERERGR